MFETLQYWLLGHGVSEGLTFYIARTLAVVAVLLLSAAANFVVKRRNDQHDYHDDAGSGFPVEYG